MHIDKIRIQNYKKFKDKTFEFNNDINIIVGDNDSGKSTILEAIEIGFNCSYRGKPLSSELSIDLFNGEATKQYLESDKSKDNLPKIRIEIFIDGVPEYKGEQNERQENAQGISVLIMFDDDLTDVYNEFISKPDDIKSIPKEFYKIEWYDFSGKKIKFLNRKVRSLFVDPARLHPTYGRNQYISNIIKTALTPEKEALLNLNYRQLKQLFNDQPQVLDINKELDSKNIITDGDLEIVANITSTNSFETGMQLAVDKINFPLIGRGEQNTIQLKLAIQNKADNIDVVMIEEPENHLSHSNLWKLVKYIEEKRNKKQLFITTHSSYVLNKLSLEKLCLISDKYIQLKNIDAKVARRLKRLPGYDTLRVVLSKKLILVEGPSDELVLKKIFLNEFGCLPEEKGIDIIVVRGIGFGNYLEIAKHLNVKVNVVKDNDGDYVGKIEEYANDYKGFDLIKFFYSKENKLYSLEPVLIDANSFTENKLNSYAKQTLSTQTYNNYIKEKDYDTKKEFLLNWYKDGTGAKKVDSAIKIFESEEEMEFPCFLKEALSFE